MKRFVLAMTCVSMALALAMPGVPEVHADTTKLSEALYLVAMLESRRVATSTDMPKLGSGIILGSRADLVFLATARHVVRIGDASAGSINVEFFFNKGKQYEAQMVAEVPERDLAVLSVDHGGQLAGSLSQLRFDVLADVTLLAPSSELHTVGYDGSKWNYFSTPDHFKRTDADGTIQYEPYRVSPGASGGALLNSRNELVGMVQNINGNLVDGLLMSKVIALSSGTASISLSAHEQTCDVTVDSSPSGAVVSLDGVAKGTTPKQLTLTAAQAHRLQLLLVGHAPVQQQIDCSSARLDVQLPINQCSVNIDSDPAGAEVLIGSVHRGATPLDLSIDPGRPVRLAIRRQHYKTFERNIDCNSGPIVADLEPQTVAMEVSYSGDQWGCNLGGVRIRLAGETKPFVHNPLEFPSVPEGQQRYSISGTIVCPYIGACQVSGNGRLNISSEGEIGFHWVNSAPSACTAELALL